MSNQIIYYDESKTKILNPKDIDEEKQVWRWSGVVNEFYRDAKTSDEIMTDLRNERSRECFSIINRGNLWYETLTDSQKAELKEWYQKWLDVTKTLEVPEKPEWLK